MRFEVLIELLKILEQVREFDGTMDLDLNYWEFDWKTRKNPRSTPLIKIKSKEKKHRFWRIRSKLNQIEGILLTIFKELR